MAALIGDGRVAGLGVLIGTSSPVAAAQLAPLVGARLILRIADPSLAAILAASAGGQPRRRVPSGIGGQPAPRPAVSAGALLSLGRGEFVLTVSEPAARW